MKYTDYYKYLINESSQTTYEYASTHVSFNSVSKKSFLDFINSIPKEELDEQEGGAELDSHVTILYGIKEPAKTAIPKIKEMLKNVKQIKVTLGKITVFENPDFDVLKVDVNSPDLTKINTLFRDNLEYHSDYPDYKPHLTLCFLKKGMGKKYVGDKRFEGKEFLFHSIVFSDKRSGNKEDQIVLEMSLNEDLGVGGGMASGQAGLSGQLGTFSAPNPVNTTVSTYSPQSGNIIINYGSYETINSDDLNVPGIDPDELRMGMRREMGKQKFPDKDISKRIAIDNITRDPKYYSSLKMYNEGKNMNENKEPHDSMYELVQKIYKYGKKDLRAIGSLGRVYLKFKDGTFLELVESYSGVTLKKSNGELIKNVGSLLHDDEIDPKLVKKLSAKIDFEFENKNMNEQKYEHCIKCDQLTDRAGAGDDSRYLHGKGPYCEDCYEELLGNQHDKDMKKENLTSAEPNFDSELDNEPTEFEYDSEGGDISTTDHQKWYQYGKLYHQGSEDSLKQKMDKDQFWPNVFFISDHGNAHLIDLSNLQEDMRNQKEDDEAKKKCPKCKRWVTTDHDDYECKQNLRYDQEDYEKDRKENLNESQLWNRPITVKGKPIKIDLAEIGKIIKGEQERRKSKSMKKMSDAMNVVTIKPTTLLESISPQDKMWIKAMVEVIDQHVDVDYSGKHHTNVDDAFDVLEGDFFNHAGQYYTGKRIDDYDHFEKLFGAALKILRKRGLVK